MCKWTHKHRHVAPAPYRTCCGHYQKLPDVHLPNHPPEGYGSALLFRFMYRRHSEQLVYLHVLGLAAPLSLCFIGLAQGYLPYNHKSVLPAL